MKFREECQTIAVPNLNIELELFIRNFSCYYLCVCVCVCARARPMLIPIYLPVLSYRPSHLATIHAKMALDRDYRQQNQFGRHSLTMVSFAFINIPYNRIFGRQPLHNTAQVRKFVLPTLCACMRAFVCSFTAILYCSFS